MNAKTLIPLTAAALFAVCAGSMLMAGQSLAANANANATADTATASTRIVNLPAVTVRPDAKDLAYFQSHKIVNLATVTVRPDARDLAQYLASSSARIVDMPVVTVRPSAQDLQVVAVGAVALAQHLASR